MVTPSIAGSVECSRADEGLQTISLSSDDDDVLKALQEESDMLAAEAEMGLGTSHSFERRADKFKRNSLKKVDSIKKAFTREKFEKKMNQITTKIVPPEKREKLMKSLTPNHPKSPTAKSSSFKVSPMTFKVKKVRDGETPTPDIGSPGEEDHVEIPHLGNMDGDIPLAEVHIHEDVEVIHEMLNPSTPDSMKAELAINGKAPSIECEINGDHTAGLAVPEQDEDLGVEEDDEEGEEEEKLQTPVETAAEAKIPTATAAVEQAT